METIKTILIYALAALAGLVAVLLFTIPLIALAFILEGIAVYYLWIWFVVPLGLSQIGLAHAIGLSTLISLVCISPRKKEVLAPFLKEEEKEEESLEENELRKKKKLKESLLYVSVSLCRGPLVLLIGYIITLFM